MADGRFPSPGVDKRFPSPGVDWEEDAYPLDRRFPTPGTDTRFDADDTNYGGASSHTWTPADDTSGLIFQWIDIADAASLTDVGAGVISTINDKSGGARHWAQANNALRGTRTASNPNFQNKPTIRMPAGGDYGPASAWTFPADFTQASAIVDGGSYGFSPGFDGPGGASGLATGIYTIHWQAGRTIGNGRDNSDIFFLNGTELSIGWAGDASGAPTNGGLLLTAMRMTGYGGGGYGRIFQGSPVSFLGRTSDHARTFDGDVGEVIYLVGTTNDALRQKYEGYMAWKWGLQGALPAGHPYKSAAPVT